MKEILIMLMSLVSLQYQDCHVGQNGYVEITQYQTHNEYNITICNNSLKQKSHVLVHELGHVYWYEIMSDEQKEEWTKLHKASFKKTGTLWNRGFVSHYATLNEEEDFSETFLHVALGKRDNEKTKFIKGIIRNENN